MIEDKRYSTPKSDLGVVPKPSKILERCILFIYGYMWSFAFFMIQLFQWLPKDKVGTSLMWQGVIGFGIQALIGGVIAMLLAFTFKYRWVGVVFAVIGSQIASKVIGQLLA